jgi:hypothetical protein
MLHALRATAAGSAVALGLMLALTAPSTDASGQARGQAGGQVGGMAACRTDIATFCQGTEAGKGARMKCLVSNNEKLQPACAAAVEARLAERQEKRAGNRPGDAPNAIQAQNSPAQGGPLTGQRPADPSTGGLHPREQSPRDLPPGNVPPGDLKQGAGAPGNQRPFAARPAGGRPMAACRSDMQTLCAGVQPGGGARNRCLTENQAKLSPACFDALQAKAESRKVKRAEMRGACKADAQTLCAAAKGPERRQCLTANVDKVAPACAAALSAPRG